MAYQKTVWQNGQTSIDENNLNKIENELESLDNKQDDLLEEMAKFRKIPCCTFQGNGNIESTGSTIKLPLTTQVDNNDEFELSDGGIRCPYDGTVFVTASMMLSPRTGYSGLKIYKNSNYAMDAYFPAGVQNYGLIEFANRPLEVNEGDIIYLYGQAVSGDIFQTNNSRSRLTLMYTKINYQSEV